MKVERGAGAVDGPPFPIYEDLVGMLLAAHGSQRAGRDATVAHVLATCAGYAFADMETVATMIGRLGLEGSACVRIAQEVDAMLIFSTAYLLQSRCGRVVILCYRGTEPATLGSWLGDADVGAESITIGGERLAVHAGFDRNMWATRWAVVRELELALQGKSLRDPGLSVDHPMEALYVKCKRLFWCMAVIFGMSFFD
jgi:hypothetical protein